MQYNKIEHFSFVNIGKGYHGIAACTKDYVLTYKIPILSDLEKIDPPKTTNSNGHGVWICEGCTNEPTFYLVTKSVKGSKIFRYNYDLSDCETIIDCEEFQQNIHRIKVVDQNLIKGITDNSEFQLDMINGAPSFVKTGRDFYFASDHIKNLDVYSHTDGITISDSREGASHIRTIKNKYLALDVAIDKINSSVIYAGDTFGYVRRFDTRGVMVEVDSRATLDSTADCMINSISPWPIGPRSVFVGTTRGLSVLDSRNNIYEEKIGSVKWAATSPIRHSFYAALLSSGELKFGSIPSSEISKIYIS